MEQNGVPFQYGITALVSLSTLTPIIQATAGTPSAPEPPPSPTSSLLELSSPSFPLDAQPQLVFVFAKHCCVSHPELDLCQRPPLMRRRRSSSYSPAIAACPFRLPFPQIGLPPLFSTSSSYLRRPDFARCRPLPLRIGPPPSSHLYSSSCLIWASTHRIILVAPPLLFLSCPARTQASSKEKSVAEISPVGVVGRADKFLYQIKKFEFNEFLSKFNFQFKI